MNEAERRAAADQLLEEVRTLRLAQRNARLALGARNHLLRQMKAGGFTLGELGELSGLRAAMLSRITSAKRGGP